MSAPQEVPDIGGWSHERIWKERQDFCKRIVKLEKCTGWWLVFQQYCLEQKKLGKVCVLNK